MVWKPARKSAKFSLPMATTTEVPMAESTEYRPPTQSQNPKAFAGSMPNSATLSSAVDTATKCFSIASFSAASVSSISPAALSSCSSQLRASRALVSVSRVVNVLDATMNSVVAGSRSAVFSYTSVGSMLETKRACRPSCTYGFNAS